MTGRKGISHSFFRKKMREIEFRGEKSISWSNLREATYISPSNLMARRNWSHLDFPLTAAALIRCVTYLFPRSPFFCRRRLILKYQAINGRGRGGGHFLHHHLSTAASVAKEGSLNASRRRRKVQSILYSSFLLPLLTERAFRPFGSEEKGKLPVWHKKKKRKKFFNKKL